MKITGPRSGPDAVQPASAEARTAETQPERPAGAPSFASLLDAEPAGATAPSEAIGRISAQLKAGEITPAQATELLVDAVVRARVPAIAAELQDQLRATLRRLLDEDPVLSAKVRRLTEGR